MGGSIFIFFFSIITIIIFMIVFFFFGFLFIIIIFYFYVVTPQYQFLAYCSSGFGTCDVLQGELVSPSSYSTWRNRPLIYDTWKQVGPAIHLGIR
jgi:hypothetical protein